MKSSSIIELSKEALDNNLSFIKSQLMEGVKLSSVVKGNAYGHGVYEFVPMAEECGIDHFSVFSADEALRVCEIKQAETEVMIMGWIDRDEIEWAIQNHVQFYVFELDRLQAAIETAGNLGIPALIHLEVETGMNRTGLRKKALDKVVKLIRKNEEKIIVKGLCTHYAGAESIANHVRVQRQYKVFNRIYNSLLKKGIKPELCHTASSAASMTYPKTQMDMVRVGILQYGFWPSAETYVHYVSKKQDKTDPLNRVISWKSKVMSIKEVNEGEFVSYGTVYLATEPRMIAVVPAGYSHGYSRSLSNQGRVLINGYRVAVIGMVNMNMLIADITNIPDVNVGDEVVMIGNQGEHSISVSAFTELSEQLNYELLSRLPEYTTRMITN